MIKKTFRLCISAFSALLVTMTMTLQLGAQDEVGSFNELLSQLRAGEWEAGKIERLADHLLNGESRQAVRWWLIEVNVAIANDAKLKKALKDFKNTEKALKKFAVSDPDIRKLGRAIVGRTQKMISRKAPRAAEPLLNLFLRFDRMWGDTKSKKKLADLKKRHRKILGEIGDLKLKDRDIADNLKVSQKYKNVTAALARKGFEEFEFYGCLAGYRALEEWLLSLEQSDEVVSDLQQLRHHARKLGLAKKLVIQVVGAAKFSVWQDLKAIDSPNPGEGQNWSAATMRTIELEALPGEKIALRVESDPNKAKGNLDFVLVPQLLVAVNYGERRLPVSRWQLARKRGYKKLQPKLGGIRYAQIGPNVEAKDDSQLFMNYYDPQREAGRETKMAESLMRSSRAKALLTMRHSPLHQAFTDALGSEKNRFHWMASARQHPIFVLELRD